MNNKYYILNTIFLTKALIKRGDTFLILKDIDSDQSNDKKGWETPGGHIEKGEDLIDSLKREVFEETGLKDINILFPFHAFLFDPDTEKTMGGVVYITTCEKGEVSLDMKEHSIARWCTLAEIDKMSESRGLQQEFAAYKKFLELAKIL